MFHNCVMLIFLLLVQSYAEPVSYVQNLIGSTSEGETLLLEYDQHYDGLPPDEKMKEKATYPEDVYEFLLAHRKTLH